jgi:tetratricopeptide (TPR) repeat protein
VSIYATAFNLKPNLAGAYFNRGLAYCGKGLHDQAIADCTKAIELEPDWAEPYVNRGGAYVGKGLHDQAMADYTKAIELKPDWAEVIQGSIEGRLPKDVQPPLFKGVIPTKNKSNVRSCATRKIQQAGARSPAKRPAPVDREKGTDTVTVP